MKLLADSCVLVWWLGNPHALSRRVREAISSPENEVFFSAASVWELGLKIRKGKLRMPGGFPAVLAADGFAPLSVTADHAARSLALPPVHEDPFDRILVAQALVEGLVFVTRDGRIREYPVAMLEA
ncbi:MAG TPA: type II toxin-antitoxin system VapC family toxin [Bacteroidia bacterium]|nr:type II toxin-antitoxin system VapC family toxin [Bacteroidia bacterium]